MPSEVRSIRICSRLASGVLVVALGAALTACGSGATARSAPESSPRPDGPARGTGTETETGTILAPTEPAVPEEAELPEDVADIAADFATAWASHDARPGGDTSYADAGKRAAAFTSEDLGAAISADRPGTASLWRQWTAEKTTITATVLKVSLPDGAPAPTNTTALARVLYRLSAAPEKGEATSDTRQLAVQLERGADGRWRVIALPYA